MKTLFKGLALGLVLTAATVAPSYAQDDPCAPIYANFTGKYKSKNIDEIKAAIAAGEELVAKCSANESYKDPIAFVNKQLPKLKAIVDDTETTNRFNTALKDSKNVNVDEAFASGKAILAKNPDLVDVTIALAAVGFDKAAANPPVDKYNADAINFAKQSIQKIEGGAKTEGWGAWDFNFKKKEGAAASKDNTLSWMNYYIGYIMYHRQNAKKEAMPYLYKSTQYSVGTKTIPGVYQMIGDFYKDEFNRIDDERLAVVKEGEAATDDETKKQKIEKAKELLALQKGYADRMIDAYARARNNAGTDQVYKDSLYNTLKVLYEVRFDGKKDGLDAYLSSAVTKPMPDPTSSVSPITETTASTTPTSSTTTTNVPKTTPATTTPATTTKTVSAKPTTNGTTAGTATKTTPAKKPVTKKKGTR